MGSVMKDNKIIMIDDAVGIDILKSRSGSDRATNLLAKFSTLVEIHEEKYDVDENSYVCFGYVGDRPHIVIYSMGWDGTRRGICIDRDTLFEAMVGGWSDMESLIPAADAFLDSIDRDSDNEPEDELASSSKRDMPEAS